MYILVAFFVSFFFFNLYLRLPSFVLFFFLCTEILGLLRYGNMWKETSDMEQKSRFHYHTCIYKLNIVQRHAIFGDKSLTVMMRSISRSQFELITEFSGLCLFLCRSSMWWPKLLYNWSLIPGAIFSVRMYSYSLHFYKPITTKFYPSLSRSHISLFHS